ncbi:hypothetical protein QTI66_06705 [Variovorax sp. J22R133]|uniref:hypothetical protein n=1 Tax=Variovorax brevis TaxID=3053503 RepID=UPI002575DED0|nr:hypothetical protein [Variovorax sp. J22R133]MDM0111834.1 hypothetical protein [Variovorax sp. J22R133]
MMKRPPAANLVAKLVLGCVLAAPWMAQAANDFSVAEQALFMNNQLGGLKPPLTLRYEYRKTGTLEEPFEDKVDLFLTAQNDGSCCAVRSQFFTGARAMTQPEVESAQGNPAILYFLERDIREMQRLTKGQPNYFRKRIRMAVYEGATLRNVSLPYRGKPVAVREFTIAPYVDDPMRTRYEKLANKTYTFLLSDAVPGGLYGIRTRINAEPGGMEPLMREEMLIQGADPAALAR